MADQLESVGGAASLVRLGRRVAWAARLLAVLAVLGFPLRWLVIDLPGMAPGVLVGELAPATLSPPQLLAGAAVDLVVALIAASMLLALGNLGRICAEGGALSSESAAWQCRLGRRLLWLALTQFLYTPAINLSLSLFLPPGKRLLVISIGSSELMLGLAALAVFLFGRMTEEAARLAEENAQIV